MPEVIEGFDRRQHPLVARLGQQGTVIPLAEITVAPAEVNHLGAAQLPTLALGEVVFKTDDVITGEIRAPILDIVYNYVKVAHL